MSAHRFCTYFDHRYLDRGLCLHASLRRHLPEAELWVLCLDNDVLATLSSRRLPGVRLVPLAELEAADPALARCRGDRSVIEYYFTCTPVLTRHVLRSQPAPEWVTYLDADLYFFSSPAPLFQEMHAGDVGIVPHRFPPSRREFERYGKYNVGWVSFRATSAGERCLDWWRDRCLEWCRDAVEDQRFADQKYLDFFHQVVPTVVPIAHPGADLAPWNLATHAVTEQNGQVLVDGVPLVFYHFHGSVARGDAFDDGLTQYGATMTDLVRRAIYEPYLREVTMHRRIGGGPGMRYPPAAPPPSGWLSGFRRRFGRHAAG